MNILKFFPSLLFDFTSLIKAEQDEIKEKAAFTEDEEIVFDLRCKGRKVKEMPNDFAKINRPWSIDKIKRLSARVKSKTLKVLNK